MAYNYPYGNGQQLNLDWFLNEWKNLLAAWEAEKNGVEGALQAEIDRAEAALADVFAARDATAQSAANALESKNAAAQSASDASGYLSTVQQNATAAQNAASAAAQSESNAADSAQTAVASKNAAGQSERNAAQSEANAVASKDAAAQSASDADASKRAAAQSAGNAEDAASSVEASAQQITTNTSDISNLKESTNVLKTALNDFVDDTFDIEEHKSLNLLDPDEVEQGYYWTDGFHTSTSYVYTGLIEVEAGKTYTMQVGVNGIAQNRSLASARFLVFYKEDGTTVDSSGSYVTNITVPTTAKYLRGSYNATGVQAFLDLKPSFVEGTTVLDYIEYFAPYTSKILKAECNNDPHIQSIVNQTIANESGKLIFMATSDSLAANTNLICCDYSDNKKNEYIEFYGKFSSFGTLTIAHGKGSYGGGYIEIDSTKIKTYLNDGTLLNEYEHGLTISDFLDVVIYTKNDPTCRSNITIMTAEGDYTAETTQYYSSRAAVLCNATFAMTNVKMQYIVNDAKEDVWVFGDSYISLGDGNRWATKLVESGHKHLLLNGFGGAMSENVYPVVEYFADIIAPKYIVWCLGINDGDSGAINSSWKTCVDDLLTYCEAKGITPILATIPNVPNIDSTYKNAYVKSLNVRYVDFAKAVNAESAGATWYTGMLSSDNTHPSELGAKALMRQFLLDVPEVLYAEE